MGVSVDGPSSKKRRLTQIRAGCEILPVTLRGKNLRFADALRSICVPGHRKQRQTQLDTTFIVNTAMREIGSLDLQLHQDQLDDNDADDSRLLDLYAQWELGWAQQEVAGICGSLPNKSTHVDTKSLLHLCELEHALACLGEPRTVFGARKLLGMTVKLLAYRMQHPESTRDQGPELQLVRNVNEALKWLDGQTRLYPHAQSDKVDADTKSRNHQAGPFELFRHAEKEHAGRSRPKRALPSPDANIILAAPL